MIIWPASLIITDGQYGHTMRSLSGGPSLSGHEQIVPQMIDRWQARYMVPVRTRAQMLAMRAMLGELRGRAGTIALPALEVRHAPWRTDQYGRRFTPKFVRKRDLDGTPYADPVDINDTLIVATVALSASAQGTLLEINMVQGDPPEPGMRFSLKARLYEILAVSTVAVGRYRMTVWPWLRFPAVVGQTVDFASPVCEMRLASDDQGQDAMLSAAVTKFASVTLQFDEASPINDDNPPVSSTRPPS